MSYMTINKRVQLIYPIKFEKMKIIVQIKILNIKRNFNLLVKMMKKSLLMDYLSTTMMGIITILLKMC